MNIDRAFKRAEAFARRISRIAGMDFTAPGPPRDYQLSRTCLRRGHGSYIGGGGCPVCAGVQKPAPRQRGGQDYRDRVERALHERPPSGPVEL